MTAPACRCESCGLALDRADAICPVCDAAYQRAATAEAAARFLCPHCARRFDMPQQLPWPPDAKWYRPRLHRPGCPHCQGLLRDRSDPRLPPKVVLPLVAATLASYLLLPHPHNRVAFAVLLAVYVVVTLLVRERSVPPDQRYARWPG